MRLACSLAACLRQDLTQTDSILPLSSDFERDCTRARASSGEAVTREKRGRCAVIFVSRAFRSRKERLLVVYISPLSRNSLGDATLLATRKPIIIWSCRNSSWKFPAYHINLNKISRNFRELCFYAIFRFWEDSYANPGKIYVLFCTIFCRSILPLAISNSGKNARRFFSKINSICYEQLNLKHEFWLSSFQFSKTASMFLLSIVRGNFTWTVNAVPDFWRRVGIDRIPERE